MNISPIITSVRAVASEFASRIYIPIFSLVGGVLLVIVVLLSWLTTLSGWWWLALVPVIIVSIVFMLLSIAAWLIIKLLKPEQRKDQRKKVKSFVDKLQNTSDVIQTPKFILIFRLIKDAVLPRQNSFIGDVSSNVSSLKPDFQEIIKSFQK